MPNIRTVDLRCPPVEWLRAIHRHCPSVRELSLSWGKASKWGAGLTVPLPWLALTALYVRRFQVDICFELLLGCPNLIQFSCMVPLRATADYRLPQHHHMQATTLPRLEYLLWYPADQQPWNDNLLQFFRFPALRHFAWTIRPGKCSLDLFRNFMFALPQTCNSLQISAAPETTDIQEWARSTLPCMGGIDRLKCTGLPFSSLPAILSMVQVSTCLPSLTRLEWTQGRGGSKLKDHGRSIIDQLHEMLLGKKSNGTEFFRFEVEDSKIYLTLKDRDQMGRLMDDGKFKVEVVIDGVVLDL